MDIKKEREAFEEVFPCSTGTVLSEYGHYESQINQQDAMIQNISWVVWQAAKAQAVPNAQQALHDRLLVKSIREHVESHISEISVNDLFDKGWLAAMKCIQNNIDMLELQEPAND